MNLQGLFYIIHSKPMNQERRKLCVRFNIRHTHTHICIMYGVQLFSPKRAYYVEHISMKLKCI